MAKYINRLKVVLAEQHKTNLWLAKTLGKDPATVSKWCTNTAQPSLGTLHEIAKRLNVDIRTLLNATEDVLMACELSTPYGDHEGDTKLTFQLNKKIELAASLTNILNKRSYNYTTYSQLSSFESRRRLRGRQLLFSITLRK